jgi:hypothetical protein
MRRGGNVETPGQKSPARRFAVPTIAESSSIERNGHCRAVGEWRKPLRSQATRIGASNNAERDIAVVATPGASAISSNCQPFFDVPLGFTAARLRLTVA